MKSKITTMSDNARIVEVILYIENEAISAARISELSGLSFVEVTAALKELKELSTDLNRGLMLVEEDSQYFFSPCQDLYERLRKSYGRKVDRRLSRAALETLAIVAYEQPVTRKRIDKIRGVSSDTIVRILREREYIKVSGRDDSPGHPCLYSTTKKFLFEFSLKHITDLPKLNEIDRLRFEKQAEDTVAEDEGLHDDFLTEDETGKRDEDDE